jgi:GAF domain-containing protein
MPASTDDGHRETEIRELERLAAEHAALRRVATLVARGVPQEELFAAVTAEVGRVLVVDTAAMSRYEPDRTMTTMAVWSRTGDSIVAVGSRRRLGGPNTSTLVLETGRPARIDEYQDASGPIAAVIRDLGVRSAVGVPISVEGRLWGVIHASSRQPLPADTEQRLTSFTELVATAIANSENSAGLARLAEEQGALRRVATLVAAGLEAHGVFAAVADEVRRLFGADITAIVRFEEGRTVTVMGVHGGPHDPGTRIELDVGYVGDAVRATGRAARFDTDDPTAKDMPGIVRAQGIRSALGSPIMVSGQLWGAVTAATSGTEPMSADAESRIEQFTELVATAVSNMQARTEVERLAAEQTALRRVATLVARKRSPGEVFAQVAEEVALLLEADTAGVCRYERDEHATLVAAWGRVGEPIPVGSRFRLDDEDSVPALVYRTERPARVDGNENATGCVGEYAREVGLLSACGAPIFVGGRLWGSLVVASSRRDAMLADAESRMAEFTELVATAISDLQARSEVQELAEEQAALRRVAELVARGASPTEIFTAIAEQIGRLLGTDEMRMMQYESDREAVIVASAGELDIFPVGSRWPLDGENVASRVYRTRQAARIDDYAARRGPIAEGVRSVGIRGVVGTPILVRGQVWGAMLTAAVTEEPLPPDTGSRLGQFTELMATAIANAEARAEVERLAEVQAALRRVATLVAQGAPPSAVFEAVAAEMNQVLRADGVALNRYEPDEEVVVLAHSGLDPRRLSTGTRVSHRGENVTSLVRSSARSARLEHHAGTPGPLAAIVGKLGVQASVGAPIIVDGGLWGVVVANWRGDEPPPRDTEERMAKFAELLDTAIANADSRDQLTASRARLLTEADEARRRVVRDLHDGAQQRLVHTIVTLKLAQRALHGNDGKADSLISEALEQAQQGNAELRELAHGILPAVLAQGGLHTGVNSIVSRLELPVEVDIPAKRFPAEIEASAYFVVAEALTNVVKHSHAGRAEVRARVDDGMLHVEVSDDGVGGPDPNGHGLVGLADRVTTLGGRLDVSSRPSGGTLLSATLPLSAG